MERPGATSVPDLRGALGPADSIGKVIASTDITHTQNADLDLYLISPNGKVVTLTTDNGGPHDNAFAGITWLDVADPGNPVPDAQPNPASNLVTDTAYTNLVVETTLTPEEPLATFNGEDPNGTWTLIIRDDASPNAGTLNSWSLRITVASCEPPELCGLGSEGGDPCSDRQAQDCVGGGADYFCAPSVVTLQQPDNRVEVTRCDCYYVKSTDCEQAVGLGESSIHCGFGACGFGVCSILENGRLLSTLELPIASMVPGAEYSCGCAELPGDLDGDGDVDLRDLSTILVCFGQTPIPPGCESANLNGDDRIDLADMEIFLGNLTGPLQP